MAFEFVAAKVFLFRLELRGADDDGFACVRERLVEQIGAGGSVEVLDDIAKEDEIVDRKARENFPRVAHVNFVVEKAMHLGEIRRVAFDAVEAHLPMRALLAGGVAFGFVDVRVFAEEVAPFAEADADVEDGAGADLAEEMDDDRDGGRATAGHGQFTSWKTTRRSFCSTQGKAWRRCWENCA